MAVWEITREAMQLAHGEGQQWLTAGEAFRAVEALAPGTNRGTVVAFLRYLCINDPSKKHAASEMYRRNPVFVTDDPVKHGKRYRLLTAEERSAFLADPRPDLERFSYTQVIEWLTTGAPLGDPEEVEDLELDPEQMDPEIAGMALLELHLQDYVHRHWSSLFPTLRLYEGDRGREFRTSDPAVGILDFLAVDADGNFVVIETKRDVGDRRAVGQILSYIGWVKKRLCTSGQTVRGVLLIGSASDELKMAISAVGDLRLMTYQISFTLTDTPT